MLSYVNGSASQLRSARNQHCGSGPGAGTVTARQSKLGDLPRGQLAFLIQLFDVLQESAGIDVLAFGAYNAVTCRNVQQGESVELAPLEWVAWFNHHRLLEPIGNIPPAEKEENYYRQFMKSEDMKEFN